MKANNLKNFDQADAQALLTRLQDHASALRGLLHTSTGELVSPPSGKGGLFNDIRALETHCGELEGRLGSTAPAFHFEIAQTPAPAAKSPAPVKKLTLTEKVLAAKGKGAKNFTELATRRANSTVVES
jgi:hypothetical protein